jgi:hypothetical protein
MASENCSRSKSPMTQATAMKPQQSSDETDITTAAMISQFD